MGTDGYGNPTPNEPRNEDYERRLADLEKRVRELEKAREESEG